ncbi:hypothetical protein GIB67_002083 [Kingdonia uniflora]|uniref:Uncharacterized protein n=1 Tax=Kingdonia uniflora TaxID=39325 RepID=A0A7J7KWJ3_9MAGN|nr:hypothetical protein GIB67_002083 [Kingdonia uniflora]
MINSEASSSTTSVVGIKGGPSRGATMLPNGEKRDVSANDLGQPTEITDVPDEDIKSVMKGLEKGFYFPHVSEMYLRDRLATFWRIFKSDKLQVCVTVLIDKILRHRRLKRIRKCERLNPESKTTSMTNFVAKSVDKDRKGRLIGLGVGVCPTLLKKVKHLLIQNEDLCDTNIELAVKVDVLHKDLQKVKDTVNVLASTSQGGSRSTSQPPSVPFQAPISAPNLHLNKKCILNGFSEAKVARGEAAFVDPVTPIHQGCLQQSKSPENLLRLVSDCRLQIADVGHFCFRSMTGRSFQLQHLPQAFSY